MSLTNTKQIMRTLYQVYKYKMRIFSLTNALNSEEWLKSFIQSMLYRFLYIFPSFEQFVNTTPVKIFPFLLQTVHRTIFSHLRIIQNAGQQTSHSSIHTSGNQKVPCLVRKMHGIELPSWVRPTCRELVLPYIIEHFDEDKWLCVVSFGVLATFQAGNGSNRSIVVGNV